MRKNTYKARKTGDILAVLCIAWLVDHIGEPPDQIHPVVWYGKGIHWLLQSAPQKSGTQFVYGIIMLLATAPLAILPSYIIHRLARAARRAAERNGHDGLGFAIYAIIEGAALKSLFAGEMLAQAGQTVRRHLENADLPAARDALQMLVSRDRTHLTGEQIASASIESLAENMCDSVTAPIMYYAIGGLPSAAIYRLVNTFDAMIGYHGTYEYLGKAAARFDDLLNIIPARITALMIIALAPLYGGNPRHAWKMWRRDANRTDSPNAGHSMAAMAGALGIQLQKTDHYTLGDRARPITLSDMVKAEKMVRRVGLLCICGFGIGTTLWRWRHARQTASRNSRRH